ncbi:MAG: hypothetical protein DWQ02_26415 [Bacteroidetes bacterium]|nr:MAG: hypothetical protein DWQ02_26415 [Bacteroidota bacterium]
MREFLILLYGGTIHSDDLEAMEKHEHLVKWGTYLGKVNQTGFHLKGSPLNKIGKVISAGKIAGLSAERSPRLNAYMIFRADDFETILPILKDCPLLESADARIEVLETQPNIA